MESIIINILAATIVLLIIGIGCKKIYAEDNRFIGIMLGILCAYMLGCIIVNFIQLAFIM